MIREFYKNIMYKRGSGTQKLYKSLLMKSAKAELVAILHVLSDEVVIKHVLTKFHFVHCRNILHVLVKL